MSSTCFEPKDFSSGRGCTCSYGTLFCTCVGTSSLVGRRVCSELRSRKVVEMVKHYSRKCAVRCFILYNYITMHGAKKIKFLLASLYNSLLPLRRGPFWCCAQLSRRPDVESCRTYPESGAANSRQGVAY